MSDLRAALDHAVAALSGLSTARSDAAELVSRLAGVGRSELRLRGARPLSEAQRETLERWLERRRGGEPVQYITGRAAFRTLDLAVNPSVLIPRPETEQLVEAVLGVLAARAADWPAPRVLDLGTGSGAIALAIAAEWPAAVVLATDASDAALSTARDNAAALGLATRVTFLAGHWFEAVGSDERFEVVVSNPPYIADGERASLPADVRDHEPPGALFSGPSGLEALREIVDEAPRHLARGGVLALELDETRASEVAAWIEGGHDWSGVELLDDLSGRPRLLLARRESGPAIAPAQWPEERARDG